MRLIDNTLAGDPHGRNLRRKWTSALVGLIIGAIFLDAAVRMPIRLKSNFKLHEVHKCDRPSPKASIIISSLFQGSARGPERGKSAPNFPTPVPFCSACAISVHVRGSEGELVRVGIPAAYV